MQDLSLFQPRHMKILIIKMISLILSNQFYLEKKSFLSQPGIWVWGLFLIKVKKTVKLLSLFQQTL